MTKTPSSGTESPVGPERLLLCVVKGDLKPREAARMLCPKYIRHGSGRDKLIDKSIECFEKYQRVVGFARHTTAYDLQYFANRLRHIWDLETPEEEQCGKNGTNG